MTPAVANLALAKGTAYDVALVIQDAAAQPIDLTGCILAASIMSAPSPVDLAVTVTDAAAGLATVHIPAQPLGMADWELWMQATPETPKERVLRGLVTVAERVDPRDEGNPSSHRLIVRISDAVTVTVDSVDLAWWAYEQTRKLLGVDYATIAAQAAATAQQADTAAHTSSVNAAAYATEAMRHKDNASFSAAAAATSERNAGTSAQAAAVSARTASDAQGAVEEDAQEVRRLLDGFDLGAGTVDAIPYGGTPSVSIVQGPAPGSHILNFWLVTGPKGDKGDPGTLTANAGDLDLGGHLTATGGTFSGAVNANGGINIPLAVGAQTNAAAVNRLYAAGMAGVINIYTQRTYLDTGSITATGAAASTAIIPGQYAKTVIPANTHSTVVHNFIGPVGQWNYSSFAGLSVPWQLSAAGKFAIGIGRGNKTVRKDLTQDSYSIIPGNDLAYNTGEILDITFTNVRDTSRGGYEIRVREIYCTESMRWKVKTTTSFIPASGNEPIPYIVNKIIYQQYAPRSYVAGDYGDAYGALYLLTGGGSNQQLWMIATVRGCTTFETGPGFSSIVSDVLGVSDCSVGLFVGTAERTNYQPGNVNPVYYALAAIAGNAIETESTADFVDINEPFES